MAPTRAFVLLLPELSACAGAELLERRRNDVASEQHNCSSNDGRRLTDTRSSLRKRVSLADMKRVYRCGETNCWMGSES